jgi:D-3-phosphoglycerate dehydrogenase
MHTILLVEKIHPKYMNLLERRVRVVRPEAFDEDSLHRIVAAEKVDAIIIRTKGCVTERILRASPNLKVVGRHGIGVDHIDVAAALRLGIVVVNTPGGSRIAVAEHTWGMILALAKNSIRADAAVRAGDYELRERLKSFQLAEKTLGVIGLGRIGSTVAETAMRGFGMNVIYTDILAFPKLERRLRARRVPLRQLLKKSDVVTIHTPLNKATRGMIGAMQLSWMQPHALLINCARGAIVDTRAVAAALESGKLGGAGIDVFDPEVPPRDHPLLESDKAILSPHSAAQTLEANLGYAAVVDDVLGVLAGKKPRFPVTASEQ